MQFKLEEENDKMIKIGLINADTTLIMPIIEKLNENKNVKIVRFIEEHPELINPALYVEMYEGNAREALLAATNSVYEDFKGLQ